MEEVKLIECPRDAMQGLSTFIPTEHKVRYLNELLKVGFDTIDIGSFVSPKAIPQLADTADVLSRIDVAGSRSALLVIVANERGAEQAAAQKGVTYLGYPFSISETFQQRNTNTSIEGSWERTRAIARIAEQGGKQLVVYISMAFGNPYGDHWNPATAIRWAERLANELGVRVISLADTVGVARPKDVGDLFEALIPALPAVEFGAHLHARPDNWLPKVEAAWNAGCRRYDHAIRGFGGCPMAEDELVGNLTTEVLVRHLEERGVHTGLDAAQLERCVELAAAVFPAH